MLQKSNTICLKNTLLKAYNNIQFSTLATKADKCSSNILKHFSKSNQISNLDLFPSELKRATSKKDTRTYVADNNAAEVIAKALSRLRVNDVPFFEINPGPCILTKALLSHLKPKKLGLIERNPEFLHFQQELAQSHPSNILLKPMKHRWTNYNSTVNFILEHCAKKEWHESVTCQIFRCSQFYDFHQIIADVVQQRKIFANGRVDIFATIPSIEYMKMTALPNSTYLLYTQKSCIFQILFEYELLAELPKESFLPWYSQKPAFRGKFEYDTNLLYLVRITPRSDLFSLCQPDDLPLLRFFVYQCLFKRSGYIIPKLEQWIPGIGADLISSKFEHPSYKEGISKHLMQHLRNTFHIFTENGSLTPLQICALFQFFKKSPQYQSSCFHQQCKDFYRTKTIYSTTSTEQHAQKNDSTIDVTD